MHTCARARTHARTQVKKTPLEVVQRTARHAKGPGVDFDATSIVIIIIVLMLMRMHESGGVQTKRLGRRRPHLTSPHLTSPHLRPPLPCIQHDLMTSGNTIIQKHLIYVPVILTNPTTTQAMVRACVPPHRSVIVSLVGYFSCAGGPLTTCGMCRSCGFFLRSADVRHSQSFSDAAA